MQSCSALLLEPCDVEACRWRSAWIPPPDEPRPPGLVKHECDG